MNHEDNASLESKGSPAENAAEGSELWEAEWTIMIYLAGDNNLSAHSIAILQELEKVRHDRNVRVIAAFDSPTPWPKGARYVEINRHQAHKPRMKWPLHNDLVQPGHIVVTPDFCEKLPSAPSPSEPIAEESLARFLLWASQRKFRAKRYMLILFGHGTIVASNTFLSDTNPPSYLRLTDFSRILRDSFKKKIDILALDNCVMNGIETAVQLRRQVDYTIGSQGLMLAVGWPFKNIVEEVIRNYRYDSPKVLAEKVLKVCARNLLDFTFMERSSEQAICDVSKFGRQDKIIKAVRDLSAAMQDGLVFQIKENGATLKYPIVRDIVRLARLEAQSYWSETFVDLYDFCELLLARCNDFLCMLQNLSESVKLSKTNVKEAPQVILKDVLQPWTTYQKVKAIADCCTNLLISFRSEQLVPRAYYVCPDLQYSHGVSIYFPWTLAQDPITFEPVDSRSTEDKGKPKDYYLRTPFQEYKRYDFAKREEGDWARFLEAFFRATLRNVRVHEYEYVEDNITFFRFKPLGEERGTPAVDLQKSSSSTGEDDDCPQVKNYPRRFYLSPDDCKRTIDVFGFPTKREVPDEAPIYPPGRVSYLGWNIRGLVAEVIEIPALETPENPAEQPGCPVIE